MARAWFQFGTIGASLPLFFLPSLADAVVDVSPETDVIPGYVSGTDTHFDISNSSYRNIRLQTDRAITASVSSLPGIVEIFVTDTDFSNLDPLHFEVRDLAPNHLYHLYEHGYEIHTEVYTDAEGIFTFERTLSGPETFIIQEHKSTTFIRDDALGGDCVSVGAWDVASKTCVLSSDIPGSVQIVDGSLTLEGNGHSIVGSGSGLGLVISSANNVVVRNLTIQNFTRGLFVFQSTGDTFEKITSRNNAYGVYTQFLGATIFTQGIVSQNTLMGIWFENPNSGNTISDTLAEDSASLYGVFISNGSGVTYLRNTIRHNSSSGLRIINSGGNLLRDNILTQNPFELFGQAVEDFNNDIDISNTVDGKPILYLKNVSNQIFDNTNNAGVVYCISCRTVTLRNFSISRMIYGMYLFDTANSVIEHNFISSTTNSIYLKGSYNNIFRRNTFTAGDRDFTFTNNGATTSDSNTIYQNNFLNTKNTPRVFDMGNNSYSRALPEGGNYWVKFDESSEGCTDNDINSLCDTLYSIPNSSPGFLAQDFYPWTHFDAWPQEPQVQSCCSNVLFLPGTEASRLYTKGFFFEDQLWEPQGNQDANQLKFNLNGVSINPSVYTRDIIAKSNYSGSLGVLDQSFYESFVKLMNNLVASSTLHEWSAFPYDWRMDVRDIVANGSFLEDGSRKLLVGEIERLASSSDSGKVTIISHSNGGLLGKVLISELGRQGKSSLVDKFIMVGTPQIGTSQAIAALLHGYEQGLGPRNIALYPSVARELGMNMPGAYGLFPFGNFLSQSTLPIITFDTISQSTQALRNLYGDTIDSVSELESFLLDISHIRTQPQSSDTATPSILNPIVFNQGETLHNAIDVWTPPDDIQIIEVIGWGLPTVSGIKYEDQTKIVCTPNLSACTPQKAINYAPLFDRKGDGTVLGVSAQEVPEAQTYFIDLPLSNQNQGINHDHADIFETKPVEDLIPKLIKNNLDILPTYISTTAPAALGETVQISVHSPLNISATDTLGRRTGLVNTASTSDLKVIQLDIPNSNYFEAGEGKYIQLEKGASYQLDLKGTDIGAFTILVENISSTSTREMSEYMDIPLTDKTKGTILVATSGSTTINLDIDGDGKTDQTLSTTTPSFAEKIGLLRRVVNTMSIDLGLKAFLQADLLVVEKIFAKDIKKNKKLIIADFNAVELLLKKESGRKIKKEDAQKLIILLEDLKLNL